MLNGAARALFVSCRFEASRAPDGMLFASAAPLAMVLRLQACVFVCNRAQADPVLGAAVPSSAGSGIGSRGFADATDDAIAAGSHARRGSGGASLAPLPAAALAPAADPLMVGRRSAKALGVGPASPPMDVDLRIRGPSAAGRRFTEAADIKPSRRRALQAAFPRAARPAPGPSTASDAALRGCIGSGMRGFPSAYDDDLRAILLARAPQRT